MNIPHNPLGIRDKRILLLLGLLLALIMPMLALKNWHELQNLSVAEEELETARKIRAHKQAYIAKVKAYQAFAKEVKQFLHSARQARILEEDWVTYEVKIKDRLVNLNTMRTFLDNAQSSNRYYFRPKVLQITSLYAEQLLPLDVLKILDAARKESTPPGPTILGESASPTHSDHLVGQQVLLTLEGTYMVKRP